MKEKIWKHLKNLRTPGFFITAEIKTEGGEFPNELDEFIGQKLQAIRQKELATRKFLFKEVGWIIYLTFFPTDRIVDERYALKNKVARKKIKLDGRQ